MGFLDSCVRLGTDARISIILVIALVSRLKNIAAGGSIGIRWCYRAVLKALFEWNSKEKHILSKLDAVWVKWYRSYMLGDIS